MKTNNTDLSFVAWVREIYLPNMVDKGRWRELEQKIGHGVAYLNKAERDDLNVYIKDGIFYNSRHERFHTGDMETNVAGQGWGIFVMDLDDKLYVHSHKQN
ncbi:hypothetical protein, partial [Serratia marcescens]|uniref:hypothetical protein n=1 Tax=Serratia marcescens TaxID=615 RepID=UPI0011E6A93E